MILAAIWRGAKPWKCSRKRKKTLRPGLQTGGAATSDVTFYDVVGFFWGQCLTRKTRSRRTIADRHRCCLRDLSGRQAGRQAGSQRNGCSGRLSALSLKDLDTVAPQATLLPQMGMKYVAAYLMAVGEQRGKGISAYPRVQSQALGGKESPSAADIKAGTGS